MFNIFEKFLTNQPGDEVEMTPEQIAAEEKADRIAFHRAKVRNGPVKFGGMTNGQIRRAQARAQKTRTRKTYRAGVKNYFDKQQLASQVFAHLQRAGVIPFVTGRETPLAEQIASTSWLVQRFGAEIEVDGTKTGHVSFRRSDVVDALVNAAKFYNAATGAGIKFPADFEPAVALDESANA